MVRQWRVALLIVVVSTTGLQAQMRGGGFGGRASGGGTGFRSSAIVGRSAFHRDFRNRELFLGTPFLYSDYYPDYPPAAAEPEPQPIVVMPPQPVEPAAAAPLTIELQGDRYARINGHAQYATENTAVSVVKGTPAELPPAVLIFRDATKIEVSRYAIIQGVLYANADYSTTGTWTRQIRLADLNLPATLEANRERGVKFLLPGGPNEVVTRP